MPTHITVPLPDDVLRSMRSLFHENLYLWLFLSQNNLLDDARDFLTSSYEDPLGELPFS